MTQFQICGREEADTRSGTGAESVGMWVGGSGVTGGVVPPPQEANASARKSPRKTENIRFSFLFTPTVYYITHSFHSTLTPL